MAYLQLWWKVLIVISLWVLSFRRDLPGGRCQACPLGHPGGLSQVLHPEKGEGQDHTAVIDQWQLQQQLQQQLQWQPKIFRGNRYYTLPFYFLYFLNLVGVACFLGWKTFLDELPWVEKTVLLKGEKNWHKESVCLINLCASFSNLALFIYQYLIGRYMSFTFLCLSFSLLCHMGLLKAYKHNKQ